MPYTEPVLGYCHALTVEEAVGRLIGYKPQDLRYDEVLDCAIEKAESEYDRSVEKKAPDRTLETLSVELEKLKQLRAQAMHWHNELNTAADEIAQELPHPTLVLSSAYDADGLPRFTIKSLYIWAKSCHCIEVPEWDTACSVNGDLGGSASQRSKVSGTVPQAKGGDSIQRRLDGLIYIVADVTASYVSQLAEREETDVALAEGDCWNIEEDKYIAAGLAKWVAGGNSPLPGLAATAARTHDTQARDTGNQSLLVLGALVQRLAEVAENARKKRWTVFQGNNGEDTRSFLNKDGLYSSNRLYDYMLRSSTLLQDIQKRTGEDNIPGFDSRTVQDRLNKAKSAIKTGKGNCQADEIQTVLEHAGNACNDLTG